MKKNCLIALILGVASLFLSSCDSCSRSKDKKLAVRAEKIKEIRAKINTPFFRYEKDLFAAKLSDFPKELARLQKKYPFFLNGDVSDPKNQQQLYGFITDPVTQEIYQETMKKFPSTDTLKLRFDDAFSYYNYYFPNSKIPTVYTYVSSLDYELPIKYQDSILIIALDMYMGANCKYYKQLGLPLYKTARCTKEYILADCFKEMAYSNLKYDNSRVTLLDQMILEGKRLYFAESMLPYEEDSIIVGYSGDRLKWAQQNESQMWGYLIDKQLLYTPDSKIIMKLINDAPFTSLFSNDSPGRAGAWIGWQIIRSYMNNTKNANLVEMLNESNSQKILNLSKYKPKKM